MGASPPLMEAYLPEYIVLFSQPTPPSMTKICVHVVQERGGVVVGCGVVVSLRDDAAPRSEHPMCVSNFRQIPKKEQNVRGLYYMQIAKQIGDHPVLSEVSPSLECEVTTNRIFLPAAGMFCSI